VKITIINGPNLNLLGKREPSVYGTEAFETFLETLRKKFPDHEFTYHQSNVEGELVTFIQLADGADGIILNSGAYTHTSLAIADAIAAIHTPVVEVHISNVFAREDFRHVSYSGAKCIGSVSGLGLKGYELAINYFIA
jgi:3-dehydroquinate dehydratase-2